MSCLQHYLSLFSFKLWYQYLLVHKFTLPDPKSISCHALLTTHTKCTYINWQMDPQFRLKKSPHTQFLKWFKTCPYGHTLPAICRCCQIFKCIYGKATHRVNRYWQSIYRRLHAHIYTVKWSYSVQEKKISFKYLCLHDLKTK